MSHANFLFISGDLSTEDETGGSRIGVISYRIIEKLRWWWLVWFFSAFLRLLRRVELNATHFTRYATVSTAVPMCNAVARLWEFLFAKWALEFCWGRMLRLLFCNTTWTRQHLLELTVAIGSGGEQMRFAMTVVGRLRKWFFHVVRVHVETQIRFSLENFFTNVASEFVFLLRNKNYWIRPWLELDRIFCISRILLRFINIWRRRRCNWALVRVWIYDCHGIWKNSFLFIGR